MQEYSLNIDLTNLNVKTAGLSSFVVSSRGDAQAIYNTIHNLWGLVRKTLEVSIDESRVDDLPKALMVDILYVLDLLIERRVGEHNGKYIKLKRVSGL